MSVRPIVDSIVIALRRKKRKNKCVSERMSSDFAPPSLDKRDFVDVLAREVEAFVLLGRRGRCVSYQAIKE